MKYMHLDAENIAIAIHLQIVCRRNWKLSNEKMFGNTNSTFTLPS